MDDIIHGLCMSGTNAMRTPSPCAAHAIVLPRTRWYERLMQQEYGPPMDPQTPWYRNPCVAAVPKRETCVPAAQAFEAASTFDDAQHLPARCTLHHAVRDDDMTAVLLQSSNVSRVCFFLCPQGRRCRHCNHLLISHLDCRWHTCHTEAMVEDTTFVFTSRLHCLLLRMH